MKLIIATDHRGVEFKKGLIERLKSEFEIVDASPKNFPTDDYPDFAFKVGKMILAEGNNAFGVLACGSGIGMCIAANKVKGIRCALIDSEQAAFLARADDDANIIALASNNVDVDFAAECIRIFANSSFKTEEKYQRRVQKVLDYENGEYNEV